MTVLRDPGTKIDDKYELVEKIGSGSVGMVYRARNIATRGTIAIKLCDVYGENIRKQRIEREVRIMQAVHHENVMEIFDFGVTDDIFYIVMPLARHSLLKELISCSQNHEQAFDDFTIICNAAQALHDGGAIHRDIKPGNLLRMQDGRIVISDLGIARFLDRDTEPLTTTNAHLGTAAYMAPEQCEVGGARNADVRCDVYQLTKTLYHMLTADLPMHMDLKKVPFGLRHVIEKGALPFPGANPWRNAAGGIR